MKKILLISFISSAIVLAVSYFINYRALLSMQPKNGVFPKNFTSFPPSAAWMDALPHALAALALVFIICWLIFKFK